MAGVIPNVEEGRILEDYVRNDISLRLYSNDYTPIETSTLAAFTEVAGGGYAAITLNDAEWVVTPGAPSVAEYAQQTFTFTGATTAPGTIYGYYLVDIVTGLLIGAERFSGSVAPFTPAATSTIKITPHVEAS